MCVEHGQDYKEMYDLYNKGLQENMQQYQQIIELEEENEKLKGHQMAMMTTEGHACGGIRW
jgi:hypothetical protein